MAYDTNEESEEVQETESSFMQPTSTESPELFTFKSNRESVLADPSTSLEEKESAATDIALQEKDAQDRSLAEKSTNFSNWQSDVDTYKRLQKLQEQNPTTKINIGEMPDPSQFGLSTTDIADFSNRQVRQQADEARKKTSAEDVRKKQLEDEQAAALAGEQKARQELSAADGYMAEMERISRKRDQLMEEKIKLIDKDQEALDTIDPNRFWNNMSTGNRIIGAISIAMGEIGRALTKSDRNNALNIINDAIDRDVNSQKLNNEQKLAVKQNALKRVGLEIERYSEMSKDTQRKFEAKKYTDAIEQQRLTIRNELARTKYKNGLLFSEGMDRQEFERLATPEERARAIDLPDGKIALATSANGADTLRTNLAKSNGALTLAQEYLKEVRDYSVLDKANFSVVSAKRKRIQDLTTVLTGALREPVTGPGAMSETDRKFLIQLIANPNDLFTTPGMAVERTEHLVSMLGSLRNAAYRTAGLPVKTTNEDNVRIEMMRRGKSPEAIDRTIKNLRLR